MFGCGFKHSLHFDAVPSMFRGMTRVTWSCLYFWAVSVSGDIITESGESCGEDVPSFLQVTVDVNRSWRYDTNSTSFQTTILNTNTSRSGPKIWEAQAKTVETGHEAACLGQFGVLGSCPQTRSAVLDVSVLCNGVWRSSDG